MLKDDKGLFPPYQGAPLLRKETLQKYPELEKVLNKLSGKITDEEMRKMNYEVNVNGKSSEEVAKQFYKREVTSLNLQEIYKFICLKWPFITK